MAIDVPSQTVTAAHTFITDPSQITSKDKLDVQPFTIDKLFMTHSMGDSTWSPDGKQVAFITNISGRNNLWLVSAESGWPVQLTVSDQRQTSPAWSPNGRWIAFASDHDGDEQWDIFLVSPANGQIINLTNTPQISEEEPTWSPDGNFLAYTVKPKESSTYEIEIMEVLTKQVRKLTGNTPKELGNFDPIWSRNGKSIVYTQQNATGKNSNIFIANVASGKATNLTPHEGEHNFFASHIS
ncbi:MAG TPA: DPP IV N-terminal domain-containing protein, partial [Candidatus Angelobacter sp.]